MTYREYEKKCEENRKKIRDLECECEKFKQQYIQDNSPLKIGDLVQYKEDRGFISSIDFYSERSFRYKWRRMKKDGTPSLNEQYLWDTDEIKKLEE